MRDALGVAMMAFGGEAAAQRVERPFTGPSIGVEAGVLEHHFALAFERYENDVLVASHDFYYRASVLGGGVFAGYDIAASRNWRLGVEIAGTAGGRSNVASVAGFAYEQRPKVGIRGMVRAGYVLTSRLMPHGSLGYAANAYIIRDRLGIDNGNAWGSGFVIGGGTAYRINRRYGVRLDVEHVDNQTWQAFVGAPIWF